MDTKILKNVLNYSIHKTPLPDTIWLIITVRNACKYINKCLESITNQECTSKIKLAICDDASTDGTAELIETYIDKLNKDSVIFIKNTERKYKLRNLINLLNNSSIQTTDVCCFLDGDDYLMDSTSLQTVLDTYQNTGCWITYGTYKCINNPNTCCREMTKEEKERNDFRGMPWIFSHLFTFRYFLWKSIPDSYFSFDEEGMYQYTSDQMVNLTLLEIAKSSRIQYIKKIIYGYNDINILNVNKVNEKQQIHNDKKIRSMPRIQSEFYPCYDYSIIIPYRKRMNNLKITYESIKESIKASSKQVHCMLLEHSEEPEAEEFCKENRIEYFYVPIVNIPNLDKFNRGLSFDVPVVYGLPAKGYVFHDVDIFVPLNFWESLEKNLINQNVSVLQTYANRCVNNINQESTIKLHSGKLSYKDISNIHCIPRTPGSWGGSIYIERNAYYTIGGHDPDLFSGYAPEDQSIVHKCSLKNYTIGFANTPPIELYHQHHALTVNTNPLLNNMIDILKKLKNDKDTFLKYIDTKKTVMLSL
jgi:glycosyltransferase involved in cell wall biosynthesis